MTNNTINRMMAEDTLIPELRHTDANTFGYRKAMRTVNWRRARNTMYSLLSTGIIVGMFAFIAANVA